MLDLIKFMMESTRNFLAVGFLTIFWGTFAVVVFNCMVDRLMNAICSIVMISRVATPTLVVKDEETKA